MIQYYVLWKKNNPMLIHYLWKYHNLIIQRLEWVISEEIFQKIMSHKEYKTFLFNWDISAIINTLYNLKKNSEYENEEYKKYEQIFLEELHIFLSGQSEKNIFSLWTKIWDTNIALTTYDKNPYNKFDAHPDHQTTGGILWWWEKSQQEWLKNYQKTFELLQVVDEWFYDELNMIINKIVPLWTSYGLHNSASYTECIGHLYMWYTVDVDQPELSNLEAIIHESSHNKLNVLFHFDKIILNDLSENYYSPFRPDARHLKWVFLAIHAFVPTIYVLMKAYQHWYIKSENWLHKMVLYYIKNKITWKVLKKYAHFTQMWNEIMDEIEYVMKQTDIIFRSLDIHKDVITDAINQQKIHFQNVNQAYPNFKY